MNTHIDSNKSDDFLIAEYNSITQYILKNQELGEKRVNLFITLATVLGSAVGLLNIPTIQMAIDSKIPGYIGFAMLISMLLFGIVTFKRMVKRSEDMDRYQKELLSIRNYFVQKDPMIDGYSSRYPYDEEYSTTQLKDIVCLQDGSLWVTVGLLNSILFWLLIFSGFTLSMQQKTDWSTFRIVVASLGALGLWIIQFLWRKYRDAYSKEK